MPRTTSSRVESILVSDYDGETDLTIYIESANSMTTDIAECAEENGTTLSATKLELIEAWLSAYFYALMDKPFVRKQTADASAEFQVAKDRSNNYLQGAMSLDPTGCLAALSSGNNAQAYWLGKPPSEQIDYVDRD